MRSAAGVSRVSRILVVLGFLSLLVPATAIASGNARGGAAARQAKNKRAAQTKKSKEKVALQRAKQGQDQKKGAKAAGVLPRPGAKKVAGKPEGAGKLAGTRTASVSKTTSRARTTAKTRRPARKTLTKKTRKTTPTKRRSARTQRTRSRRPIQELAAGEAAQLGAPEGPDGMRQAGQMGDMDFDGPPVEQRSRFRRFMSGAGRAIKTGAKYAGYALVVAAPMAVMAAGGLPIAFAIGAPAIFLGIPLAIGLIEQRAKQNQGIDDPQGELLQRYMGRQMMENHDLNGPGPGNGIAGAGGLNTLNNMIDPGGMR